MRVDGAGSGRTGAVPGTRRPRPAIHDPFGEAHMTAMTACSTAPGIRRRGRAWVITLGDAPRGQALDRVVRTVDGIVSADDAALVVDAGAVTSADDSLVEWLTAVGRRLPLCVAAPSPTVRTLLRSSGAGRSVPSASCMGEALDSVGI